ncbi:MAG: hypothetical protein QF797_14715 [Alphaproteobacteria bacterium]|nr:hypothetical protein [Rhodospirillaceae bacterium]MDP6406447.1 hypothetical protein [Alphaproteobacteria bacterium]MDP6621065.1 hypothetical protein [Alphaproteobacteria bacterium]
MTDHQTPGMAMVAWVTKRPWFPLCPDLTVRENRPGCCLVPEEPPKRPDPGLYSQSELLAAGSALSWDSPDITTNLSGRTTLDENVRVTVRNYSADASAVGTQVGLEYSRFGIGFARAAIGALAVDLNRAGSVGDERTLDFYLPSAVRDEHDNISVRVTVNHPHDRNAANNSGEQAWSSSSATAGAAAQFGFQLHNSLGATTDFDLLVMEADWSANLSDGQVTLMPGQARNITLTVQVPSDASSPRRFNVVALVGGGLYGGVHHRFDV